MSKKKKGKHTHLIISVLIMIIVVLTIFISVLQYEKSEASKLRLKLDKGLDKEVPDSKDFIYEEEGTIEGWTTDKYFKEDMEKAVVLFASAKILGLTIVYYPEDDQVIAGTPQMVAKKITLFDGKAHHLAYSFKKGGRQRITYDGQIIAESEFKSFESYMTGMAVWGSEHTVSESFVIDRIS
ncbi:MAG: hypothetical protein AABX24_02335 [Nanoarchaeota archaeon]